MSGIHLSQEELSEKIKSHFHWRSIDADVTTTIEICDQCIPSTVNIPGDTVWKKVEITVHGPFDSAASESKYVIMIRDTYSNFVNAEIVDNDAKENVVKSAANYVFSTLCQFGFTSCVYVSQSRNLYEAFVTQIDALLASLDDVPLKARAMVKFAHQPSGQGNRLAQQLQEFAEVENWPYKFDAWLFKMRTSMQDCLIPPFSVMFSSRDPIAINHGVVSGSVNDVVSFASKPSARRVLKKSMLICRHCEEAFTSRISFRLHQKHHLEDARNRGVIEGEEVDGGAKKKRRMKKFSTTSSVTLTTTTAKKLSTSPVIVTATVTNAQELTESTVSAVKALLAATKDDRLKRGKYFKYSKELKEEIAAYAMEHGNLAAANHYTTKLNNPLAESSVRNFVKYYSRKLSEALREEIGKFAYHFGTDECINVYKGKESLTKTEVKRLRSEYVEKHPDATTVGNIGGVDVNDESIKKQKLIFEESLRNEIGHYAFLCSNSKAVQYFTDKLQLPVKESTVRKFKLAWMAKNNVEQVTSIPAQHRDQADDVVLVNDGPDFELLDQSYMEQQQQQILKIEQVDFEIVEPGPSSAQSAAQPIPLTVKETKKAGPASEPRKAVKKLKTLKKKERLKRGNYANYDPSLRAEIAKFSLTHTNQETVLHFKKRLGVQLPESTVRGLRAKLQRRIDNDANVDDIDNVSELDHFQRGRPMRLGAYDSVVRDCIEKLIQTSGEKVSSFMVIATAKQVLMQHDPGLLHENGGYIKLNPTWAKSFLKRLGVRSKD